MSDSVHGWSCIVQGVPRWRDLRKLLPWFRFCRWPKHCSARAGADDACLSGLPTVRLRATSDTTELGAQACRLPSHNPSHRTRHTQMPAHSQAPQSAPPHITSLPRVWKILTLDPSPPLPIFDPGTLPLLSPADHGAAGLPVPTHLREAGPDRRWAVAPPC